MDQTKYCPDCDRVKPGEDFYANSLNKDGLGTYCRKCTRARSAARHAADPVRSTGRMRSYYRRRKAQGIAPTTPNKPLGDARYFARHRERCDAHGVVYRAIGRGTLTRPDRCERCGAACKPHGHHADYAKPLEVEWLCSTCHGVEHRRY